MSQCDFEECNNLFLQLTALKSLDLVFPPSRTKHDALFLSSLCNLKDLILSNLELSSSSICYLTGLTSLECRDPQWRTAANMSILTNLEMLSLEQRLWGKNYQQYKQTAQKLPHLKNLLVEDEAAVEKFTHVTSLTSLSLRSNIYRCVDNLTVFTNLNTLSVYYSYQPIAPLHRLQTLILSTGVAHRNLSAFTSLTELRLEWTAAGETKGLQAILMDLTKLLRLSILRIQTLDFEDAHFQLIPMSVRHLKIDFKGPSDGMNSITCLRNLKHLDLTDHVGFLTQNMLNQLASLTSLMTLRLWTKSRRSTQQKFCDTLTADGWQCLTNVSGFYGIRNYPLFQKVPTIPEVYNDGY